VERLINTLFAAALALTLAACRAEPESTAEIPPVQTAPAPAATDIPGDITAYPSAGPGDLAETDGYSDESDVWSKAFSPHLDKIVKALSERDYASVFRLQRMQIYRDLFAELNVSIPGRALEYNGAYAMFWGRTDGEDVSGVSLYPYTPIYDGFALKENMSGVRITGVRYYGNAFMFIGNYVNGLANGEYIIYENSDDDPDTTVITYTTAVNDLLNSGGAVRCIVKNGAVTQTLTTDAYAGALPIRWDRNIYYNETSFWESITPKDKLSDERDVWSEVYSPHLDKIVKALSERDYTSVFRLQRMQIYRDLFADLAGSLPGGVREYNGARGTFYGRTDGEDVSAVALYPDMIYDYYDDNFMFDVNGSGIKITGVRYRGTAYMFVGEYADGLANGEYIIYESSDDAPDTAVITYLTAIDDILVNGGGAARYIVEDGVAVLDETLSASPYDGINVPVRWSGGMLNSESSLWDVSDGGL
jgi:hypothetical protein